MEPLAEDRKQEESFEKLKLPTVDKSTHSIPRIIGVHHIEENIDATKAVIEALPPHSKVGLEFSFEAPGVTEWVGFSSTSSAGFFPVMAQYAESRGHEVVWLERPASFITPLERRLLRDAKLIRSMIQDDTSLTPSEVVFLREQLGVIQNVEMRRVSLQAKWRSDVMLKYIEREEWRDTDIVIVGAAHAVDLEQGLHTKMDALILSGGEGDALARFTTRATNLIFHRGYDRELRVRRHLEKERRRVMSAIRDWLSER